MNYVINYTKDDYTQASEIQVTYSSRGNPTFYMEIYHSRLNEKKTIKTTDIGTLESRLKSICNQLSDKWEMMEKKNTIEEQFKSLTNKNDLLNRISERVLIDLGTVNNFDIWNKMKRYDSFNEREPDYKALQKLYNYPPERKPLKYEFTLLEKIFKSLKQKKTNTYKEKELHIYNDWLNEKKNIDLKNDEVRKANELIDKENELIKRKWEERKNQFEKEITKHNEKIDQLKQKFLFGDKDTIIIYFATILTSNYTLEYETFDFEIDYNSENKILIIEFQLPNLDEIPQVKEYKLLANKNEIRSIEYSDAERKKLFDISLYKIVLGVICLLFNADSINFLSAISFNGWVKAINKATGNEENKCILTVQVKKEKFKEININNIDPKECFRSLKGICASTLTSLTPVHPILVISKEDSRFVDSYNVADQVNNETNLAAMDWEDFENLIRELFEKEFSSTGGEVKITQASRDGGVDAIAFDPDPIRGGKIVIQAKRYTNTVGVSAVRDLYGTIMNEGANKGILVTTADYGPDSYEFAKGKPITLLNGGNLLSLLDKHGHKAKIDIKEAKRILNE